MKKLSSPGGSYARDLTAVTKVLRKPADAALLTGVRAVAISQARRYKARKPSARALSTNAPKGVKALFKRLWKNDNSAVRAIRERVYGAQRRDLAGRCPYCALITRVRTIDHFLEKHIVPELALYDHNLVPACSDCNHGRLLSFRKGVQQVIHFYDDDVDSIPDVLRAKIVEEDGLLVANFSVETPTPPNAQLYARHFVALKLAAAYREVSSGQIREVIGSLSLASRATWSETLRDHAQRLSADWGSNEPKVALLRAMACRTDLVEKHVK